MTDFFESVGRQMQLFSRIKAMVYLDTPDAAGRNSSVTATTDGLKAYRELGRLPMFQVSPLPE